MIKNLVRCGRLCMSSNSFFNAIQVIMKEYMEKNRSCKIRCLLEMHIFTLPSKTLHD